MKILHIFRRMDRGGAEMRTLDVMRYIDRDRFAFHFCNLHGRHGTLDDEVFRLGGEIHCAELGIGFPWRFRQVLREGRFDVVHSHVHMFSGLITWLAAKERVPVRIAHFRSTEDEHSYSLRRRLQRQVMRGLVDRYATNILAVSESAMSHAWSPAWRSEPRCRVVFNGLDTSLFDISRDSGEVRREFGMPTDCRLIIHVGRLHKAKNHPRLIDVFARLAGRDASARLLLVGRGGNAIEQQLRDKAAGYGVLDKITFAGERPDVARLLKAADLMVFPSVREGLPGAVLEACAAGTPVLASDLPGTMEIAQRMSSVQCLSLDDPDDEWGREALRILGLFKSDEARTRSIEQFRGSVFTIDKCVAALCEVYEAASGPGSRDRRVGQANG